MIKEDNIEAVHFGVVFLDIHPEGQPRPSLGSINQADWHWQASRIHLEQKDLDYVVLKQLKLAATRKYNKENGNGE